MIAYSYSKELKMSNSLILAGFVFGVFAAVIILAINVAQNAGL